MQTETIAPSTPTARRPCGPNDWMWCLHCGRFFQRLDARADAIGGREGCAFGDCDGAGFGVDVFDWDAWAKDDPAVAARWPSRDALFKGRVAKPWSDDDDDGDDDLGDGSAWIEPDVARMLRTRELRTERTVSHFRDLSLERLEAMLRDGSIGVCSAACGRGPSVETVRAFLRAWPEVHAHGHTESGGGEPGIAIEGLECDLLDAPVARWHAIREAFHTAFGTADEYFNEPDWLYAWWE